MAHLAAALLIFCAVAQGDRCKEPQTQAEMNVCASEELLRADAKLNDVYKQVVKAVGADRLPKLRAAQRAWLAFRDAQCDFEGSEAEGGTMQPMLVSACKSNVTKARIEQLREVLTTAR